MRFPLFLRRARPGTISALYGTIVAQARSPYFYSEYAVPDTVNGRFDLIALHMFLVLERISRDPALAELGQGLFDRFWQDMDHNLRELGIGDLSVPKKMQKLGEAYYGRARSYRAALAGSHGEFADAIRRNVYAGRENDGARRLADYARRAMGELVAHEAADLAQGVLRFPDPALIPVAG